MNRDPIEEKGGFNLYGFIANSPIGFIDLFGLENNNAPPPCAPYPDCMRGPEPPATTFGEFCKDSSGYIECYLKCMAADLILKGGAEAGGASLVVGAYYHFTDKRFTAWGRCSKVMVPRAVGRIGAGLAIVSICEAAHCADKCWKETSGADPDPPPPPYNPPYPIGWPGKGHNVPPVIKF